MRWNGSRFEHANSDMSLSVPSGVLAEIKLALYGTPDSSYLTGTQTQVRRFRVRPEPTFLRHLKFSSRATRPAREFLTLSNLNVRSRG